jgi:hypothetical protein
MGYDVHITRAEHWASNEGREIAADEWLRFVQSDPELIPTPEDGEYFVIWRGTTKYPETWFEWRAGNITTKHPDRATLQKMLQMAAAFEAKVQGDEGEAYDEVTIENLDDSFLDATPSGTQPTQAPRSDWWSSVRKLFKRK